MECIWKEKHCEYCIYLGCRSQMKKSSEYINTMNDLVQFDISTRTRVRPIVWARYIVVYQMWSDGYSASEIGRILHQDHTTILHGINQMKTALTYPTSYTSEINLFIEFKKRLLNV